MRDSVLRTAGGTASQAGTRGIACDTFTSAPGLLSCGESEVHLWRVFLDEAKNVRLLEEYRRVMTESERSNELRFYFQRDRHRYVVTRALVRTTLARYLDLSPERVRFVSDKHGRPHLANDDTVETRIEFNITHTEGLVTVAVTDGRLVGVDAENTKHRRAPIGIADDFFAPREVAELRALPLSHQGDRFFEYWTLKEAYIKARGLGLAIPLDQFSFDMCMRARVKIEIAPEQNDSPHRWRFLQHRLTSEHLTALRVEVRRAEMDLLT